jgi:ubiquinone biosynthesis protein
MPAPEKLTPVQRLERDAKRVGEITGVAIRFGLSDWVESIPIPGARALLEAQADPSFSEESKEVRARLALTELGTTFIKIGQMLATRSDLVGPELAAELSNLHANTPPDPPEVVLATIQRELGQPADALFETFDAEALASASIAQVHLATLWTGEIVAIKVQKEGVRAKVEADLNVLESLAELAEQRSEKYRDWEVVRLVQEFKRSILSELDFNRELRNIETFDENFEADPTVHFPRTWPEFSSRRVLTMEYLDGPLGTDLDALRASCVDLNEFALRGANVYLTMIFRDGFYHADPHPGNLMLLSNGVVGILDCGMVGRIDEGLRDDLERLVAAITDGDVDGLTSTIWAQSKRQPDTAQADLRGEFTDLLAASQESVGDMDIGAILNGVLGIFRKYRVAPRPGLTGLIRTLVILDGTGKKLSPAFDLETILQPYRSEAIKRRLDPRHLWKRFQRSFIEWDKFLQELPAELSSTLQRVRSGEFRVGLEHRHLDSVVNRLVLGILTSSLVLGSSLLWSMKAPPLIADVSILGVIGFVVALSLGSVLYRSIKHSGKTVPNDQMQKQD